MAGLYVGIAWIGIEGASVMLPAFDAPDWVLRAFILMAIVGFPISLVLAWVFDVTEDGIEVQAEATETVVIPFGSRRMDFVAIGVLLVALIFSVYLNISGSPGVVEEPDPLSVLIADFENRTGDDLFDGTLEQALQIGIESAPFITGYRRDAALTLAASMQPTAVLDEAAARLVALREGVKLVMAGTIEEDNGRYTLYVRAVDPQAGEVLATVRANARDKLQVLSAVGELSGDLREELGDKSLDRERLVTSETFTARNLEAAQAYAKAQSLQYRGKYDESIAFYEQALEYDPSFGRAYSGLALSASSLGRTDEAEELWLKALSQLGTMTERERLRTFGLYYSRVTRNREKAIENYQLLIDKYPADDAAHNGLAIQYFYTLQFDKALEAGGKLLEIYPGSVMGRSNYALYAMYASDFRTAVAEADKVRELDPDYFKAWLPVAMRALVINDRTAAVEAYEQMAAIEGRGASTANLGMADIAIYDGDYTLAQALLVEGIAADATAGSQYVTSTKHMALADAYLKSGDHDAAAEAISSGLSVSSGESRTVPAAIVYLGLGDTEKAREIADGLKSALPATTRAHGALIDGLIALDAGNHVEAVSTLTTAVGLADLWLIRYHRGRAFFEAGYFAEALDEFTACTERRGEATAMFLDDLPTFRYTAELVYWLGRAQEQLGMLHDARQNYAAYAAHRPEDDPLAVDARERIQ